MAVFVITFAGVDAPPLPVFEMESLLTVLLGMLGLGGLRTFEEDKAGRSRKMINPETLDKWRILPRLVMVVMIFMTYRVVEWFMDLPDPNPGAGGIGVCHDRRSNGRFWLILGVWQERMSYKYFSEEEFACQETGENKIVPEFVERLDELREACNFFT